MRDSKVHTYDQTEQYAVAFSYIKAENSIFSQCEQCSDRKKFTRNQVKLVRMHKKYKPLLLAECIVLIKLKCLYFLDTGCLKNLTIPF